MTPEQILQQRITAYTPPYIKEALARYVRKHRDMTVSKFVTDCVREKLTKVGAIEKAKKAG